jgi:filamentous hemagglutinin
LCAQNQLNIGVQHLDNREGGLILSDGDLTIGGALNDEGQVIGSAQSIVNHGATLQAMGNLRIASQSLKNSNANFQTVTTTEIIPLNEVLIQKENSDHKYRQDELEWRSWSRAGMYVVKATGEEIKNYTVHTLNQRTIERTTVASSDPGKMLAGKSMVLNIGGELTNDKSQILAGSDLSIQAGQLTNIGFQNSSKTTDSGSSQYTWERWRGGTKRYHQRYYGPLVSVEQAPQYSQDDHNLMVSAGHQSIAGVTVDNSRPTPTEVPLAGQTPTPQPGIDVDQAPGSTALNASESTTATELKPTAPTT